jgi:hypothetical protein
MLIWLLFSSWNTWPAAGTTRMGFYPFGANLFTWIMLALLGWRVFGFAIHD